MATYRVLFAVFSALSLLTLLWTGIREAVPEWKGYQKEYYRQLGDKLKEQGRTDFQRPALEIQQTWLPELGRTDRCTTCHMGVENKELFSDAQQPYRAHPGQYLEWHPPNKYGCTICHHGQGLSTDFVFASHTPPDLDLPRYERLLRWAAEGVDVGQFGYDVETLKRLVEESKQKLQRWEHEYGHERLEFFHDYMLPRKYIEASCMRCHSSEAIEHVAPTLAEARKLIKDVFKCRSCHAIPQIPPHAGRPQADCPDLLGFANKNEHNLDFGSVDAVDDRGEPFHTPESREILRTMRHDPIDWTVEHFLNPQLFIVTSAMASFGMTYQQADLMTTFVRGLYKELPPREYVSRNPPPMGSEMWTDPAAGAAPAAAQPPAAAQQQPQAQPQPDAQQPVAPAQAQVEGQPQEPAPVQPGQQLGPEATPVSSQVPMHGEPGGSPEPPAAPDAADAAAQTGEEPAAGQAQPEGAPDASGTP
jgi:hypothetical protein